MPKISELNAAAAVTAASLFPVVTDDSPDVTERATGAQVRAFVHSLTHMVPVMAGAMRPRSTGGCADLAADSAGSGQPDIVFLAFDSATTEFAQFTIPMPESWDEGTVTFQPIWSHDATTTNFGVVWGLQAVAVSNDDTLAAAFGTAQLVTDTGGTTDDLYIGPVSSAITIAGSPAAGDLVCFQVFRDHDEAGDTMGIDARLIGLRLYIGINAAGDA